MTTYVINVNGKEYEVTVQKKLGAPAAVPALAAVAVQPVATVAPVAPTLAPGVAPAPVPAVAAPVATGPVSRVAAPMPGKVVAVKVNVGDAVTRGQEVVIVEAMKMNNPILAAQDGVVVEVHVQTGDPVQTGMPLVSLQ